MTHHQGGCSYRRTEEEEEIQQWSSACCEWPCCVASSLTKLPFFASKVRLGRAGVDQVMGRGVSDNKHSTADGSSPYPPRNRMRIHPEVKS